MINEAREAAKKELGDLAIAKRDCVLATVAIMQFSKDWVWSNPGKNFILEVKRGSDLDKKYRGLLKTQEDAFERESKALFEFKQKVDPILEKHGLNPKETINRPADAKLPLGVRIKNAIRDEAIDLGKGLAGFEPFSKASGIQASVMAKHEEPRPPSVPLDVSSQILKI